MLISIMCFNLKKTIFSNNKNISQKNTIVFTFSQTSLTSGLIREIYLIGDSYLLLHSVCCDILFWPKYMKKTGPHTDGCENGRSILIASSNNCEYSFLVLCQNVTTDVFLKICCSVESNTTH